jgi:hypothetical protein
MQKKPNVKELYKIMIFMVTSCISDIKHFIIQLMHTMLKG